MLSPENVVQEFPDDVAVDIGRECIAGGGVVEIRCDSFMLNSIYACSAAPLHMVALHKYEIA
ncbi:hypothetical protein ACF0H5_002093 [Mactra antiquata]